MRVLGIDPGPTESGWAIFDSEECKVVDSGTHPNHDVLLWVGSGQHCDMLAIEMLAGMGMVVGKETFDTCKWVGRFIQAWSNPEEVSLIYRRDVKSCICGNQQAKDSNIRQALIDRLGAPGVKAKPGPTYGVTGDAWSAVAVAVTCLERMGIRVQPMQRELAEWH